HDGQGGRARRRRAVGAVADDHDGGHRRHGAGRVRPGWGRRMNDHAGGSVELLPVTGLPEFRPGDDLAAAIASAAPWLRDGDVLVVTSKAVSKVEGRLVEAPTDPAGREAARRALVLSEAVRVVATFNNFVITENALGIVQAASG